MSEVLPGDSLSIQSTILDTAAGLTQDFAPVKNICGFLNGFHCYADEPGTYVEENHYCSHSNEDIRQCLIYDSPERNARLIGVEYMISPKLYATLSPTERKLWHSHVFEVKSGMLIMPRPTGVPSKIWQAAEDKEMEEVIQLYGKTFHFWQIDKGHELPLGMPKLMGSFTEKESMPAFEKAVGDRDERFGSDWKGNMEARDYIETPDIHPDADQANVNSKRKQL
ncbi:DUF1264 domain-containing protein [Coprinopsis marcescibilis]|uniref:DUF1264 domain-containing protein n=1 Tax=Coprinopsis marcescibilis TaxID=230819 RepID=A0A5C3KHQ0_COPMA|nr:DUF1264 domain-containing protein [Coprinopsis marcescibilis]